MSKIILVAPVPRQHIAAARVVAAEKNGRVAFGSGLEKDPAGMWEFFATKVHQGMEVLIYVSATGEGEYHGYVFSHAGIFERVVADEAEVLDLRPATALATDSKAGCYWVVRDFHKMPEASFIPFSKLNVNPRLYGPTIKKLKK